jgi:putative transposase
MDGRGRYLDNIFIERNLLGGRFSPRSFAERLWRSIKYALIHLKEARDGIELQRKVRIWIDWYNGEQYHQALDYRTPSQVYYDDKKYDN